MLASISSRQAAPLLSTVARNNNGKAITLRWVSSVSPLNNKKEEEKGNRRREMHSTPRRQADAVIEDSSNSVSAPEVLKATSSLLDRFTVTAEVTVSKIFPAGFGWQTASVVADSWGNAGDSLNFAVTTGAGDALGVLGGHVAYYSIKKNIYDSSIDLTKEFQTGILLGSAAFCSGTAWQPVVNVLQGANLPFNQVFVGTWVACGLSFYLGLRVGRTILSGPFQHIEEPTYENQKSDASLSTAIGGATAFFVGTDAAYLPDQNWLIGVVGIQDGVPDTMGSCIAGASTGLGFVAAQSTLNVLYPAGKCWND